MSKLYLVCILLLCFTGCQRNPAGNNSHGGGGHSHDSGGHSHGGGDHHHEPKSVTVTLWDDDVELFIEYGLFVAGKPNRFVTHVTHLKNWEPRSKGEIQLVMTSPGQDPIEMTLRNPVRNGIYIPSLTLPKAGQWKIEVRVPLDSGVSSQMVENVAVYSSQHDADHASVPGGSDGEISFLKEQQWRMPFSSEKVVQRAFRESINANGVIAARNDGQVLVHAPASGRLQPPQSGFAHIGMTLSQGQLLGSLIPRLDEAEDGATLSLAVERARISLDYAEKELKRVKRLHELKVVPGNELELAEVDAGNANAELKAAQQRLAQYEALQKNDGNSGEGRIHFYAPLTGSIVASHAVSGAYVEEGDPLFHIIDLSRVWLTIEIPEGDIGRIQHAQGAWFTIEGMEQTFRAEPGNDARLVAFSGMIHPRRRTAPLIFELPNRDERLKIGMYAQAHVFTGKTATGPAIPKSALVEEGGQSVVYIHTGGESFERRVVQTGIREGDHIQAISGVQSGERVVSLGAYQVRLAASGPSVPDHGHVH